MSEEERERHLRAAPQVPRQTGTAWDTLPKMEAELLPDGRVSYTLARDEISIFAGFVDAAMEALGAKWSELGKSEYTIRTDVEPEEAEQVKNELRRLNWRACRAQTNRTRRRHLR